MPESAHSGNSITLNFITRYRFKSVQLWMDTSIKTDSRVEPHFENQSNGSQLVENASSTSSRRCNGAVYFQNWFTSFYSKISFAFSECLVHEDHLF
ncbi:MAG: hypothetical protein CBE00_12945 [Planctomycetaceae bacterium TMED240]|nr:hypothetical protein [Rhodopirellula sp.]OUX04242.1 MAG: hypothetical protein CBE00_12945 [Planctomycetaceae bacterium TMED240]